MSTHAPVPPSLPAATTTATPLLAKTSSAFSSGSWPGVAAPVPSDLHDPCCQSPQREAEVHASNLGADIACIYGAKAGLCCMESWSPCMTCPRMHKGETCKQSGEDLQEDQTQHNSVGWSAQVDDIHPVCQRLQAGITACQCMICLSSASAVQVAVSHVQSVRENRGQCGRPRTWSTAARRALSGNVPSQPPTRYAPRQRTRARLGQRSSLQSCQSAGNDCPHSHSGTHTDLSHLASRLVPSRQHLPCLPRDRPHASRDLPATYWTLVAFT